jgi:hypothetical protein
VAALTAPEAFEEAAVGMDVERRGLLAVERAEADEVVPAFAKRDVVADETADVGPGKNLGDRGVGDAHLTPILR